MLNYRPLPRLQICIAAILIWLSVGPSIVLAANVTICATSDSEFYSAMNYWTSSQDDLVTINLTNAVFSYAGNQTYWATFQGGNGTAALEIDGGHFLNSAGPCGGREQNATATIIDGGNTGFLAINGPGSIRLQNLTLTRMIQPPVSYDIGDASIYVVSGNSAITLNDVIVHNSSGVFAVSLLAQSTVEVTDSLFYSNQTSFGALYIESDNSPGHVINTTFTANQGGGLAGGIGELVVANSIFWANTGGADISNNGGTSPTVQYTDYQSSIGIVDLGGSFNADPLFNSPSANDYTLKVNPLSPAINVGAPPGKISGYTYPITDLAGNPRGVGTNVDLGPYESNFDNQHQLVVSNNSDNGPGSLRAALVTAQSGGPWHITFQLPTCGMFIAPQAALPDITTTVFIDGYSQAGSSPNTLTGAFNANLCVLMFSTPTGPSYGLRTTSGASQLTVKGLSFSGFGSAAIELSGGWNHVISGNSIGGGGAFSYPNAVGVDIAGNTLFTLVGGSFDLILGGFNPAETNLIFNSTVAAISIDGSVGGAGAAHIGNNLIGLNTDGVSAVGNATGIDVLNSANNILVNNTIDNSINAGIILSGASTASTQVLHNYIGLNSVGAGGNATGVVINFGANNNQIGFPLGNMNIGASDGNFIYYNNGPGVWVTNTGGAGNLILGNTFAFNLGLAIDLAGEGPTPNGGSASNSPNDLQAYPVIKNGLYSAATSWIELALDNHLSPTDGAVQIDVYLSPTCSSLGTPIRGDGVKSYLTVTIEPPPLFQYITAVDQWLAVPSGVFAGGLYASATATDASGNTSEIGECKEISPSDLIFRDDLGDPAPTNWLN